MRVERNEFATVLIPDTKAEIETLELLWNIIPDKDKSYDMEDRRPFHKKSEDDIAILLDHGL